MGIIERHDKIFFLWTYKISFALNWVTGKEPRYFFKLVVLAAPLIFAGNIASGAPIWWTFASLFMFSLLTAFHYFDKYKVEVLKMDPKKNDWSRVWWGWITMLAVPVIPFGNVIDGLFLSIAYFLFWYCQYCYLHDLPPRDSVFARAKNKIKEKLSSFSLAPAPA